ncbi:quinoprotein relay system zinc metallohydrolase 1 [Arcobacter sp. s6]|jgi:quinoprotein relay system zinc metallohydrolase 1|uniref:quinoprotein relay system zinc metallohydrolase 1 n=1 Tax=Arcobacter sp. s6 TaxID=3230363 RepID=UPI0034A01207
MKSLIFFFCLISYVFSNDFDYKLTPIKLAENSYYFYGKEEYFSKENGGDIANSSFIITKDSVILIDTGSSEQYGEQVKKQIELITKKPIKYILNTHHHPDHFLGNSAFSTSDIYASEYTKNEIETNGDLYIVNLVNIIQKAMDKTKVKAPNQILTTKELDFDGYKLKVLYFDGHTQSDIAIYDENTKILYSSDLVFYKRTLATPHANLDNWIKSLKELEKISYSILVPGHGISSTTKEPIKENIAYLEFLQNTLRNSAKEGLDIYEILNKPIPKEFESFTMFKEEFERSVINLYPSYEKDLK